MALQQRRAAGYGELLADLQAVRTASLALGAEAGPRLVDVGLDLLGADLQHGPDLAVTETVQLCEDQRGSLALWQLQEARERLTQILTLLDLCLGIGARRRRRDHLDGAATLAQDAYARIASNGKQPGAQVYLAIVCDKRPVRGRERRLNGVFGILRRVEHVPSERQQLAGMAVIEDLERGPIAATDQRHEPLVRGEAKPNSRPRPDSSTAISQLISHSRTPRRRRRLSTHRLTATERCLTLYLTAMNSSAHRDKRARVSHEATDTDSVFSARLANAV